MTSPTATTATTARQVALAWVARGGGCPVAQAAAVGLAGMPEAAVKAGRLEAKVTEARATGALVARLGTPAREVVQA